MFRLRRASSFYTVLQHTVLYCTVMLSSWSGIAQPQRGRWMDRLAGSHSRSHFPRWPRDALSCIWVRARLWAYRSTQRVISIKAPLPPFGGADSLGVTEAVRRGFLSHSSPAGAGLPMRWNRYPKGVRESGCGGPLWVSLRVTCGSCWVVYLREGVWTGRVSLWSGVRCAVRLSRDAGPVL